MMIMAQKDEDGFTVFDYEKYCHSINTINTTGCFLARRIENALRDLSYKNWQIKDWQINKLTNALRKFKKIENERPFKSF